MRELIDATMGRYGMTGEGIDQTIVKTQNVGEKCAQSKSQSRLILYLKIYSLAFIVRLVLMKRLIVHQQIVRKNLVKPCIMKNYLRSLCSLACFVLSTSRAMLNFRSV